MKKCPACAEEIQDEAIKCRYCGTNLGPLDIGSLAAEWSTLKPHQIKQKWAALTPQQQVELRAALEAKRTRKKPSLALVGGAVLLGSALIAWLVGSLSSPSASPPPVNTARSVALGAAQAPHQAQPAPTVASSPFHYVVVRRWVIPAGGFGSEIVIDPKYRTEKDLRALGEYLHYLSSNDRYAFVSIFDSTRAAGMHKKVGDLNGADGRYYDKHYLGEYAKNSTTGFHEFDFHPDGLNGHDFQVKF